MVLKDCIVSGAVLLGRVRFGGSFSVLSASPVRGTGASGSAPFGDTSGGDHPLAPCDVNHRLAAAAIEWFETTDNGVAIESAAGLKSGVGNAVLAKGEPAPESNVR